MKIEDCPFDNLQRCKAWRGCEKQFHEGVDLMSKVLPKSHIDRVKSEGNTPANEALIHEAVDTLEQRCEAQIEGLRRRLRHYDVQKKKIKTVSKKEEA